MNKKTEIKLCDVVYLLIDDKEFIPAIVSGDNKRIKNIMTGEIAPNVMVLNDKEIKPTNEFSQKLHDAKSVENYALGLAGKSFVSLFRYANIMDKYKDKIINFVSKHRYNTYYDCEFAVEDYMKLAKVLDKAYVKRRKEKAIEDKKQASYDEHLKSYDDMFKF